MEYLQIANWDRWQTYRKDRGQPPWIKIHRRLLRNPEWVSLTDGQKGQLVCLWMLAGDREGLIPDSAELIKKMCYLENTPDLDLFISLGFIRGNIDGSYQEDEKEDNGKGKIYFIEYEGSIKIGFSKNPWARVNALKVGMPKEPKLLANFDGTKEQEQELHKLFTNYRINREWYKPNKYLKTITTGGLPDVIPGTLCGLPDQPKAEAEAEAEKNRIEENTAFPQKNGEKAGPPEPPKPPKKPETPKPLKPFYLTKKKRKLKGWKLETFSLFWKAFNWKKDKANTADAWLEIPGLTQELAINKIIPAAEYENNNRQSLLQKGRTPKWAQGWLSGRRWEDEKFNEEFDEWAAFRKRREAELKK